MYVSESPASIGSDILYGFGNIPQCNGFPDLRWDCEAEAARREDSLVDIQATAYLHPSEKSDIQLLGAASPVTRPQAGRMHLGRWEAKRAFSVSLDECSFKKCAFGICNLLVITAVSRPSRYKFTWLLITSMAWKHRRSTANCQMQ